MKNRLEAYNPNWKIAFESIKYIIETELADLGKQFDIEHIGSTSIEGLYAKPVLDIDIIISNHNLLNNISTKLERIGYKAKGEQGIPGRFAFKQTSEFVPLTGDKIHRQPHHLYAMPIV
jgi:GrpB-like predicted nucleotidyltransferase (UPF0157 family)